MSISRVPRRQLLTDGVYAELRELVVRSAIPPSSRLNIEELARTMDVSPTPVREALARLESDNLVTKLPLKGYVTTDLYSQDEIRDLYELRLLLEVPSAGRAAKLATETQITELMGEIALGRNIPEDPATYRSLIDHDARFHSLVLAIAGNEAIRRAYEGTHCHLHLYRLSNKAAAGETTHADIGDAIRNSDSLGAAESMRAHLTQARDRTLSNMSAADSLIPEVLASESLVAPGLNEEG